MKISVQNKIKILIAAVILLGMITGLLIFLLNKNFNNESNTGDIFEEDEQKDMPGNNDKNNSNNAEKTEDTNNQDIIIIDENKEEIDAQNNLISEFIIHKQFESTISGLIQNINILIIDLSCENVKVKPVLSYNNVYGYQVLSEIASTNNAYAAVNAGFFHTYGRPGGLVVIDGRLISNKAGDYPVLCINGGKASLNDFNAEIKIKYNNYEIDTNYINAPHEYMSNIIVYNSWYGLTDREGKTHFAMAVEDGTIKNVGVYDTNVDIPDNGFLVTIGEPYRELLDLYRFKKGEEIKIYTYPELSPLLQAYQCGCCLVKDGVMVAGDFTPWVGDLTSRDPRTAVGIIDEQTLIFVTVDGRQPGYSEGITGKELAYLMIELGAYNAAMLDGGGSTEMIIDQNIVNKPSYLGLERPLAGAFVITCEKK